MGETKATMPASGELGGPSCREFYLRLCHLEPRGASDGENDVGRMKLRETFKALGQRIQYDAPDYTHGLN